MLLNEVMDELGDALDTIVGLRVHRWPPDQITPPTAIVSYPDEIAFDLAYGRGMDTFMVPVVVVAGKVSERGARATLSAFAAGHGPSSVKQTIDAYTGFTAIDVATVKRVEFDVFTMNGVDYMAATFDVEVFGVGGPPPAATPLAVYGASHWFDALDLTDGGQVLPNRAGPGVASLGTTIGVDVDDPAAILTAPKHLLLDGTDDYLLTPFVPTWTATTGAETYLLCIEFPGPSTSVDYMMGNRGLSPDRGFHYQVNNRQGAVQCIGSTGSATETHFGGVPSGTATIGVIFNNGTMQPYSNNGIGNLEPISGIGDVPQSPIRVGRRSGTSGSVAMKLYAVAFFPTALSKAQLDEVSSYLIGLRS